MAIGIMAGSRLKKSLKNLLRSFLAELILYSALVAGYFAAVLHFLGNWVYDLFQHDRKLYAFVALGLIITQGFLLEVLTRALLELAHREREK
jgi:hypothetical protein